MTDATLPEAAPEAAAPEGAAADDDASTDDTATDDTATEAAAPAAHDAEGAGSTDTATDTPDTAPSAHATFVPVEVVTVAFELPGPSPTIHLRENVSPYRGIDFPIGLPEAQSIAMALEGERPPRPSTHDLIATLLRATGCDVVAVRLTGAREGTLLAELDVMGPRGREVLDCRPTDGIAIALRLAVRAPILCDESLLE